MAKIIKFTQPSTAALYRKQLRRIQELWNKKLLVPQDKLEEKGISIPDVKHVIFYGRIVRHEPQDTRWRYTLKGKSIDGEPMKCVVDINGSLFVVTAFFVK